MSTEEMRHIEEQMEALFRTHYQTLVRYAQVILSRALQHQDRGRAEEAVQEAFVIAWRKWESLLSSPNQMGWLCNTVNYVARNMIRADQRWTARLLQVQQTVSERAIQPSPGADLELEGMVSPEELNLLKRLYFEGLTYEELAQELGTTKTALAKRISRIKERFRENYWESEKIFAGGREQSSPARHEKSRGGSKR